MLHLEPGISGEGDGYQASSADGTLYRELGDDEVNFQGAHLQERQGVAVHDACPAYPQPVPISAILRFSSKWRLLRPPALCGEGGLAVS